MTSIPRARLVPVLAALVVLGVAAVLELGAARSHAAVSSNLTAFVHDDASIGLNFADGSAVGSQARVPPTIPAGTYTIHVVDDTSDHNFDLTGPGVNMSTSIDGSETDNWTVTFQPGQSYRFQCDAHSDFMWGAFTTSGTASASSSSSTSPSSSNSSSPVAKATTTTKAPTVKKPAVKPKPKAKKKK